MLLLRLLLSITATTALVCTPVQPRPRHVLHAATTDADAARLTATLASSTVGRSFNFECQKQCWFIRRLPGAYQVTADGVEIVAEGPRSKLEAFERWLVKATTDTESFAAESGDGAGPRSVTYDAATGDLEGWTSRGAALDALKSAEGPGFLGAPAAGADESTNDAELADAMAEQAVVEIDYEAAAAVAATKGVVGTVPQSVREDLVGRQFGSAVLDAPEPKIRDVDDDGLDFLDLTEDELEAFAKELAGV